MERATSLPLGIVVERHRSRHPWQEFAWRPVAVIPGAGPTDGWRVLLENDDSARYHAATLPLELHHKFTEAYRINLANRVPAVYVALRPADDGGAFPYRVFKATVAPFEATDLQESGDDLVEAVPMPPELISWVEAFVERHHVDERFRKRRRDAKAPEAARPQPLVQPAHARPGGRHG